MQVREKVEKSRNTVFFQWFVAQEGRKVGSLKRQVQSHGARWEMKNCTPLWGEARFEVKMCKTPRVRTTFGSWDAEKVHTVVARSTCRSQKCKKLTGSEHFWTLRCWKSAHRCKKLTDTDHFQMSFCVAGTRDCAPCQKWAKREGFVAVPKAAKMHFAWQAQYKRHVHQRILEMLGGQGADFLSGVAFWSIRSSGLLRWFCVTGAALRMTWHHFSWHAQHFRQMEWKNRNPHWHEAVSSALNFPFLKEVSQTCCVFDVVNVEQNQNLTKSRRIASFSSLQIDR